MSIRRIPLPATLSVASIDGLLTSLDAAAADTDARVWALVGTAGTFCRGMDLAGMSKEGADPSLGLGKFADCLSYLRRAPRPTIAVIDGDVLGGGVGLAAACDVVLASEKSTFALPEALFGLLPAAILPVLVERMPPQKARLLAILGHSHNAAWARESGLVDEVVAVEDMDRTVRRMARDLGRVAPQRVVGLRSWVHELGQLGAEAAVAHGAKMTASFVHEKAVRETVRRFVEEGTPPWADR